MPFCSLVASGDPILSDHCPRTNDSESDDIDPTGRRSDAELNDALNLIHDNSTASNTLREKFRLDAEVMHEGSYFSAGERQLRRCSTSNRVSAEDDSPSCAGHGETVQGPPSR